MYKLFGVRRKSTTFALAKQQNNAMVRWMSGLVNGLQNRPHPFESGTHLQNKKLNWQRLVELYLSLLFKVGCANRIGIG